MNKEEERIIEPMRLHCRMCHTTTVTTDINRVREVGHTYPPTLFFVCNECNHESVLDHHPKLAFGKMVARISTERGYSNSFYFDNGRPI